MIISPSSLDHQANRWSKEWRPIPWKWNERPNSGRSFQLVFPYGPILTNSQSYLLLECLQAGDPEGDFQIMYDDENSFQYSLICPSSGMYLWKHHCCWWALQNETAFGSEKTKQLLAQKKRNSFWLRKTETAFGSENPFWIDPCVTLCSQSREDGF